MNFNIDFYSGDEKEWDNFILNKSINGIFIQTRKFMNYHNKNKYKDCSLCIRKGQELVACVLACEIVEDNKKVFYSHRGTTFGGITISKNIYDSSDISEIFDTVEYFLKDNHFNSIKIKMVNNIYCKENTDLIDYFFYNKNYVECKELNYYISLIQVDYLSNYSTSKRRDYKYSLNKNLVFRKLETKEEIYDYYKILIANLDKLNLNPVHTYEDLIDIKFNRFNNEVEFYGIFLDDKIIAGSMIFIFGNSVFHTQYLSSLEEYLDLFPMVFLITNLIRTAIDNHMRIFSFGICTEKNGKYINQTLSKFKEGFGCKYCVNRSYEKEI